LDDANVDFPAGVADANFNVMHAKMFKDGSNPGVNSSPNSKKTMDVDIMKQGSSGAISKKVVENLASDIYITVPIKGGPNVKCNYIDENLELVELEGITDDPESFIRCKTNHLSTFTATEAEEERTPAGEDNDNNTFSFSLSVSLMFLPLLTLVL